MDLYVGCGWGANEHWLEGHKAFEKGYWRTVWATLGTLGLRQVMLTTDRSNLPPHMPIDSRNHEH